MDWKTDYNKKKVSLTEAAGKIESGDIIWANGISDTPFQLMDELCSRYQELRDVQVHAAILMRPFDFLKGKFKGHIDYHTIFPGPVERVFKKQGNISINSVHFSDLENVFKSVIKPNTMMITCTPPDDKGYMCFGPIGSIVNYAVAKMVDKIIVQVNENMPYIYGEGNTIHVSDVDYICEANYPFPELPNPKADDDDNRLAAFIEPYVRDGDTLQIGIGAIGNAVAYTLAHKKDLGVHSEMLTDSLVYLAQKGAVTNKRKNLHPGKIVFCFAAGGRELHEFIHKNPMCLIKPASYTNNVNVIASNENMVSINSALAVDLTGQVCSESLGTDQFSATGGQADFIRGARQSKGGRSFISLKSTAKTKKGLVSRISTMLLPGSIVTTPRADVHYIVTEYGVAELLNKSIPQRVEALIAIAHPDFRDQLRKEAKEVAYLN